MGWRSCTWALCCLTRTRWSKSRGRRCEIRSELTTTRVPELIENEMDEFDCLEVSKVMKRDGYEVEFDLGIKTYQIFNSKLPNPSSSTYPPLHQN
jgi:hypothetical protein